jgi:initiation factor 1A
MVKNITGGNKSKKQARSSGGPSQPNKNVRKAVEEGEIYAVVTKINGGNNCQVMCVDGITRCCFIRNKFKTFGKHENTISVGVWILAGIRLWESRSAGVQKCDLLEVYSQTEKDNLKQNETCNFNYLMNAIESDRSSKSAGGVVFSSIAENDEIFTIKDNSSDDEEENKSSDFKKDKPKSLKELLNTNNTNTNQTNTNKNNDTNDWLNENIDVNDI